MGRRQGVAVNRRKKAKDSKTKERRIFGLNRYAHLAVKKRPAHLSSSELTSGGRQVTRER